jgi:hypothetical protein
MGSKLSRQIGVLKNINLSVSIDLDSSEVNDKVLEKLSEVCRCFVNAFPLSN